MQLFQHVGLLASLILSLNPAGVAATTDNGKANIDIWKIDSSCTNYHQADVADVSGETGGPDLTSNIQDQLTNSAEITAYALTRLNFIRGKRPNELKDPKGFIEWVKVSKAAGTVLGIIADPAKNEKNSIFKPSSSSDWTKAINAYTKVSTTLPATHNNPIKGYNPSLSKLSNAKPLFVCGDNWKFYTFTTNTRYPNFDHIAITDVDFIQAAMKNGAVGGWYKDSRWVYKANRLKKPVMCDDGTGGFASAEYDMIGMCDNFLKDEATRSTTLKYNTAKEGDHIYTYMRSFQGVLLNQLFKWYGGLEKGSTSVLAVNDQVSVTGAGLLNYERADGSKFTAKEKWNSALLERNHVKPILANDYNSLANLAEVRFDAQKKYTGPQVAGINPTSLTTFALMMWFRDYSWDLGVATPPYSPPGINERSVPTEFSA